MIENNFAKNCEKKNNTWNIRHLVIHPSDPATQQPSDSVYYIEDCRISRQGEKNFFFSILGTDLCLLPFQHSSWYELAVQCFRHTI